MTQFLVDIASYQHDRPDPINLDVVQQKGFSLVNIKTTEGTHYTFTAGRLYVDKARSLGMGICTFHYLTNEASGSAQADFAWKQIQSLGGPQGIAHECDCETTATQAIYRDYVKAMQDKLGRHILTYSGDWWWQPRGWYGADLTPYYTAAPNDGYPGSYPGDDSPQWHVGYGGWDNLSMMQYAVTGLTGAGGGNLSKSAIRDPAVWPALTGGGRRKMLDACKFGETSDAVGDLQAALVALGGTVGKNPDGSPMIDKNFGPRVAAGLAAKVGGDGSTVVVDGKTVPACKSFGVPQLLKLLAANTSAPAPAPLLIPHNHTFDPVAGVSGPAVAA